MRQQQETSRTLEPKKAAKQVFDAIDKSSIDMIALRLNWEQYFDFLCELQKLLFKQKSNKNPKGHIHPQNTLPAIIASIIAAILKLVYLPTPKINLSTNPVMLK